MNFGFGGEKLGEHAAEAERIFAEGGAHPFIARGRGIAFVENQVDHREDGFDPQAQFFAARRFKRNMCFRESFLGAEDALAHGFFRHQEGAGNFRRGEAADQTQGKSDAAFDRKDRMAGREDEPEHVIVDDLIQRAIQSIAEMLLLLKFEFAGNFFVLLHQHLATAKIIDGAALGRGHQPRAGIFGDAFSGPDFEGSDERVLG